MPLASVLIEIATSQLKELIELGYVQLSPGLSVLTTDLAKSAKFNTALVLHEVLWLLSPFFFPFLKGINWIFIANVAFRDALYPFHIYESMCTIGQTYTKSKHIYMYNPTFFCTSASSSLCTFETKIQYIYQPDRFQSMPNIPKDNVYPKKGVPLNSKFVSL